MTVDREKPGAPSRSGPLRREAVEGVLELDHSQRWLSGSARSPAPADVRGRTSDQLLHVHPDGVPYAPLSSVSGRDTGPPRARTGTAASTSRRRSKLQALSGFLDANMLVRSVGDVTEAVVATVWESIDAVKRSPAMSTKERLSSRSFTTSSNVLTPKSRTSRLSRHPPDHHTHCSMNGQGFIAVISRRHRLPPAIRETVDGPSSCGRGRRRSIYGRCLPKRAFWVY
jgi:hypothetical protein